MTTKQHQHQFVDKSHCENDPRELGKHQDIKCDLIVLRDRDVFASLGKGQGYYQGDDLHNRTQGHGIIGLPI